MDVSENSGTPKSSILIGFSIINHPFWGTPIFGNTYIAIDATHGTGLKQPTFGSSFSDKCRSIATYIEHLGYFFR